MQKVEGVQPMAAPKMVEVEFDVAVTIEDRASKGAGAEAGGGFLKVVSTKVEGKLESHTSNSSGQPRKVCRSTPFASVGRASLITWVVASGKSFAFNFAFKPSFKSNCFNSLHLIAFWRNAQEVE